MVIAARNGPISSRTRAAISPVYAVQRGFIARIMVLKLTIDAVPVLAKKSDN